MKIKTVARLKHNTSFIIHIAVVLDVNVTKNANLKHDNYIKLSSELKRQHPNFSLEIVLIVLGAAGLVTSDLRRNIENQVLQTLMIRWQQMALLGKMKIVKSVMRMKND